MTGWPFDSPARERKHALAEQVSTLAIDHMGKP
jgi:phenylpyruvate tautomerase PptA (4-oxalocrotonate tautomerase family)